jgi:hypothetical protein
MIKIELKIQTHQKSVPDLPTHTHGTNINQQRAVHKISTNASEMH